MWNESEQFTLRDDNMMVENGEAGENNYSCDLCTKDSDVYVVDTHTNIMHIVY